MKVGDFEIDEDANRVILHTIAVPFIAPGMDGWELELYDEQGEPPTKEELLEFGYEGIDSPAWSCVIPTTGLVGIILRVVLSTGLADASAFASFPGLEEKLSPYKFYIRDNEVVGINVRSLHKFFGPSGDSMRVVKAAHAIVVNGWSEFKLQQGTPRDVEEYYQTFHNNPVEFL